MAIAALGFGACTTTPATSAVPPSRASTPAPPSASPAPAAATPTTRPEYSDASATLRVAAGPRGVAALDGSVWVAAALGNVLQRIDPATNEVSAEIRLQLPVTLVTLDGQLWASVLNAVDPEEDDELVRIDTASNQVAQRITVPVFHNIAAGAGALWAVDKGGTLRRVDPKTGKVSIAGSVGTGTVSIAAAADAIFGIRGDGMAWRLPVGGGELREIELGVPVPGRSRVTVREGSNTAVWVGVPGTILALDPRTLEVRATRSISGMELVNDLWATADEVWLSANVVDATLGLDGGSVLRLDPETGEIRATFRLGPESSGGVVLDDSLWAVDQRQNLLARYPLARS